MTIVKNHNGIPDGQSEEMVKYFLAGSPTSLFEHVPEVGEYRTITVTVRCANSGHDEIAEGKRAIARWKVVEATIGRQVDPPPTPEKKKGKSADDPDPNQVTVDEALADVESEVESETDDDSAADSGQRANNDYDPFSK